MMDDKDGDERMMQSQWNKKRLRSIIRTNNVWGMLSTKTSNLSSSMSVAQIFFLSDLYSRIRPTIEYLKTQHADKIPKKWLSPKINKKKKPVKKIEKAYQASKMFSSLVVVKFWIQEFTPSTSLSNRNSQNKIE